MMNVIHTLSLSLKRKAKIFGMFMKLKFYIFLARYSIDDLSKLGDWRREFTTFWLIKLRNNYDTYKPLIKMLEEKTIF